MQTAYPEQTPTEQSRAAIEAIEPSRAADGLPVQRQFQWTAPDGSALTKTYLQDTLGMFPAQEFTTRITEVLEEFTKGDMKSRIGDLFRGDVQMPTTFDPETVNQTIDENMAIFEAFIKLVQVAPSFQIDVILLSLGVPRLEREWAKVQLQEPPHRGGLTVEEGFDILITFIKQNAVTLRETAVGKAKEMFEVFQLEVMGRTTSSDSTDSTDPSPSDPSISSLGGTPSSTSSPATLEND